MKAVLGIIGILLFSGLSAQERIDLLTVSTRYGFPSELNDFDGEALETGLLINAKVPLVLSEKTVWFNNITFNQSTVSYDFDSEEISSEDLQLYGFIVQTGIVQKLTNDRAFQLLFVPRYMTDFNSPNSRAWQFGAIGLYEKRYHEKLRLRYGFLFNQELGGPLLVPLVDVLWQFKPKWSVTGLFPIYGKLNYHYSEKLTVGISHFGLITSFDLSEASSGTYMERTSIDLSLFARRQVFGDFFIEGRLGYALGRNYEQYPEDEQIDFRMSILRFGDNRNDPLNFTFDDGIIASLRFVYSIPIPE